MGGEPAIGGGGRPDASEALRRSIARVAALPCDIMLGTHPTASGLFERLQERGDPSAPDPLIDLDACRAYAERAGRGLARPLEAEGVAAER